MTTALQQWLEFLKTIFPPALSALGTIFATALTAFATILGTVLVVFVGWFRERSDNSRRSVLIKEATDQVAFWKSWYEVQTLIGSTKDLEVLRSQVETHLAYIASDLRLGIARPARPNSLIRRALLLYRAPSYTAVLLRVIFYQLIVADYLIGIELIEFVLKDLRPSEMGSAIINRYPATQPGGSALEPWLRVVNWEVLGSMLALVALVLLLIGFFAIATIFARQVVTDLEKDENFGQTIDARFYELWRDISGIIERHLLPRIRPTDARLRARVDSHLKRLITLPFSWRVLSRRNGKRE